MRIKGSELRKIIKEEVRRAALREQELNVDLSDETEAQAKLDKLMSKPDELSADEAVPSAEPVASPAGPMAAYLDALRIRQAPNQMMAEAEKLFPRVISDLEKVFSGEKVVKTGDRGDLVKALQILIFSSLSELQDMMMPQLKSYYLRADADEAIEGLAQGYSMTPDGVFGSKTRDAVEGVQKAMNVVYKLQSFGQGAPIEKIAARPAQIDGVIGRQVLQFLMGDIGAAVTGYKSPLETVRDKSMLLAATKGKSFDEILSMYKSASDDAKQRLRGILASLEIAGQDVKSLFGSESDAEVAAALEKVSGEVVPPPAEPPALKKPTAPR